MKASASSGLAQVKVLVVDDDKRIASVVKDVLVSLGFGTVRHVLDGSQALSVLSSDVYNLVITDWQMLPMDGLTFVQKLRRSGDSPNRTVPVIMLTASAEPMHRDAASNAGITEFVVKPFTVESLCERLRALIMDPREFILCRAFAGPDRRRKSEAPPDGTEKRRKKHGRK